MTRSRELELIFEGLRKSENVSLASSSCDSSHSSIKDVKMLYLKEYVDPIAAELPVNFQQSSYNIP